MPKDFAFNFKRIAYSADGNADPDDIGATPAGLAMLAHAGLQNNLVHYHVNSQVWKKPNAKEEKMRDSAFGSASRMGFNQKSFFDVAQEYRKQGDDNAATRHLANQINASSANDPLYIVAAGPMEAVYQAVKLANTNKRSFVKVISHSSINDNNVGDGRGRTRSDLEKLGVDFVDIPDQNGGFSTHKDFGPWSWMKNSANSDLKWTYSRMQAAGKADISDAGMVYYALTGDTKGNINKLKTFFGTKPTAPVNPIPPAGPDEPTTPPAPPSNPTPPTPPDAPTVPTPPLAPTPPPNPTVPNLGDNNDFYIKGTQRNDNLLGGEQSQTIRGRKGNDRITAGAGNDNVFGNKGDDILAGVDIQAAAPGKGEQDILGGGKGADTFVLGNASSVFYNDGKANSQGTGDYAFVQDFNMQEGDIIQLKGNAGKYVLGSSPISDRKGTAIFLKTQGQNELIGIVNQQGDKKNLNLNSSVFKFV
ncbi:MAG: hypothetical protein AAFZ17_01615 [Cyanobacteria bacterium J06650_10]